MTFSDVARRSGVTRQLLYRWWMAKASLVSEALFASGVPPWPRDFDGPLEADLRRFVEAIVTFACRDYVRSGLMGLIADAGPTTPLPGLVDDLLIPLRASLDELLDAGRVRGDLHDEDIDPGLLLDTIRGSIAMHLLADQTPPDIVIAHVSRLMARALSRSAHTDPEPTS